MRNGKTSFALGHHARLPLKFGAAALIASVCTAAACSNDEGESPFDAGTGATSTDSGGTAGAGAAGTETGGTGAEDTGDAGSAGASSDGTGTEPVVPPAGFDQTIDGGGTQDGYYTFELTLDSVNYDVQTNPWGGAAQTITAGGDAVFRVDAMQEPAGGNPWDVAAFPSVYQGTAQGGHPTADSGMPIAVADLTSVATGLSTNSTSITFTGNTTYDVYFTNEEAYASGGPDVYLMVWFDSHGLNPINGDDEQWNCRSDPPTYVDSCSDAGSLQVGGLTFYRFIGPNGSAQVISYLPETPMDEWEFDLKAFIDDAVAQGVVSEQMYLQSIQAGFEMVTGGVGLTVGGFYADVQ